MVGILHIIKINIVVIIITINTIKCHSSLKSAFWLKYR